MERIDITMKDVFISWTGNDVEIKNQIAERLRKNGIEPLLSDEKCQGDFVEWSREAATSAHIFMSVISEDALMSKGMKWELEELDKKLCSDEGEFWKSAFIPVCKNEDVFNSYKEKFSSNGRNMLKRESAIWWKLDKSRMLTEDCLNEICEKTALRIISHMYAYYLEKTKPSYIKLIPLSTVDVSDEEHPFEDIYIKRKITEFDKNKQEIGSFETPAPLLDGKGISFVYGPAGCGKSQYINQIRSCADKQDIVISLSCADVSSSSRDLLEIMYDEFQKICGYRKYYTKENFIRMLNVKRLILVLDGMDEITRKAATRVFVEKVAAYFTPNKDNTVLIFTGRNEKDIDLLTFGDSAVRRFRLDKLTDEEIQRLGSNLFLLFGEESKGDEFFVRVKDLNDEIRANPLLLSQLAIVYKDSGKIPSTVPQILDAVWKITMRTDEEVHTNLQAIPEKYKEMVSDDIGGILKRFSRESYELASNGDDMSSSDIFFDILSEKYEEDEDACERRVEYLLEYLRNRAIYTDGKFYHKMFLEYFAAVSYYEECFRLRKIKNAKVIADLFLHYSDDYWRDVIKLFLIKADSCIGSEVSEQLYKQILATGKITEYTLLLDVCRELIVHKKEAALVLVCDILEKSASGYYPPYGPLFWYVPEYGLYEYAILAAERLIGNAKALALVRDVCFIFSEKYTLSDITTEVDGQMLYDAARNELSGVRNGLVELFCTGKTECDIGTDVYPRCFNISEARTFMENGHGVFGRMNTLFEDELGLWGESYSELDGEYIGIVSCRYDKAEMEQRLSEKPTKKVCGIALINTENTVMDYVEFGRTSVRVMYIPENAEKILNDFALFMPLTLGIKQVVDTLVYLSQKVRKVVVPAGVKSIGERFFAGQTLLEEVALPQGLLRIGNRAFGGCEKLREITIPTSVQEIGWSAFKGCTSLTTIDIPGSVQTIGSGAFERCTSLTNIDIPGSVQTIGSGAFERCTSLTNIEIPGSVQEIGDSAFAGCTSLTGIRIPGSVREIVWKAFAGCTSLTNIEIPGSVQKLGDYAFAGCTSLTGIEIPGSVQKIGSGAFKGCTSLTGIEISSSVQEIGWSAFEGCTSLTNIEIPDSVQKIGDSAFAGCTSLVNVEIPDSVMYVGKGIFDGCTNLKEIIVPENLKHQTREFPSSVKISYKKYNDTSRNISKKEVVIEEGRTEIFAGEFEAYKMESIQLPVSLQKIGDRAFSNCDNLRKIEIPGSVQEIGRFAFSDCTSLTGIEIPNSVQKIGEGAFSKCDNLRKIAIPGSVQEIGKSAFEGCTSLTGIEIPNSVQKIGWSAFAGCTSLTGIEIPGSVQEIGRFAFSDCTSLTGIEIPNSVQKIGEGAFSKCDNLRKIAIPGSVREIGGSAFSGCRSLTGIEISGSVQEIGRFAFSDCTSLTGIEIPGSVQKIGSGAFAGCTSLTGIEIPNSVQKIGWSAFEGCTSLTGIEIPGSVQEIGGFAFKGCTSLTSIEIPGSVQEIGGYAFSGCTSLKGIKIPNSVNSIGASAFKDCSSLTEIAIPKSVRHIGVRAFSGCTGITSVEISSNFQNDISRIFGDIDMSIVHFI